MAGVHSELSPSSAKRWLNCTASVEFAKTFPDEPSEFAAEGTAAHELAADVLTNGGKARHRLGNKIEADSFIFEVTPEMADNVQQYVDFVKSISGQDRYVEQRVSHIPGEFGTADLVAFDEATETCIVCDLKYGMGIAVNADDNPQLKLYALGVYNKFKRFYPISNFDLHIFQPRLNSHTNCELTLEDLVAWANEDVFPAAEEIKAGDVYFAPGSWCTENFCPARYECPARVEAINLETLADFEDVSEQLPEDTEGKITNDRISELLKKAAFIQAVLADIAVLAKERLLKGQPIPGYKLVAGRSNRVWKDPTLAEKALRDIKLKVKEIFVSKLISPAQTEKLMGKNLQKTKDILEKHSHKPPASPTLVTADNPKPEYISSEFSKIEEEEDDGK